MKEILKSKGLELGGVRRPLEPISEDDLPQIEKCKAMINKAINDL